MSRLCIEFKSRTASDGVSRQASASFQMNVHPGPPWGSRSSGVGSFTAGKLVNYLQLPFVCDDGEDMSMIAKAEFDLMLRWI